MPWGLRTRVRAAVGVRELGSGEDGCRGGRRGPGVGAPGLGSGDKDLGQRTEKIGIPGLEPESGDLGQSRGWGAALARGAGRGGGRQRAPVRRAAVALEGSCLRLTARPPPGDRAPPSAPPIPRGYSAPQSRPNPTALPWRPQAVSLPGHGFPARGGLGCSRRGTGAGAPGSRPRRPLLSSGSRVALLPPPRGTKGTTIPQPCSEEPLHQALQFSLLAGSLCMSSLRLRRSSKGNVLYLWGGGGCFPLSVASSYRPFTNSMPFPAYRLILPHTVG
ncbi:unnamed protein product [Rangifer tarandus platyrhynchus]|uniref:Uncharacterized protein n=1 Tax=Rangifer tarandus platyrhynchus TaxID=3082113 RepID=A0ABN8YM99_RANTA|nr:unnamed protein product [Rangifer tarandus platyrhynchus]